MLPYFISREVFDAAAEADLITGLRRQGDDDGLWFGVRSRVAGTWHELCWGSHALLKISLASGLSRPTTNTVILL